MGIREYTDSRQPRERLLDFGPEHLSDIELLSVILGSGINGKGVKQLSAEVMAYFDKAGSKYNLNELISIKGLGKAKASLLSACFELTRRVMYPVKTKIKHPEDALLFLRHYEDRKQEHFLCISLNGAHEVIRIRVVSIGLVNRTLVHPREIYSDPLKDRAAAVIIAHNHPSGNIEPSSEDIEITERIRDAGTILGIELLDHIIFSSSGYYSFVENKKFGERGQMPDFQ